ncbi:MAG: glycoside hydrolase domain-containing protein [Bacteroidota bacterium]
MKKNSLLACMLLFLGSFATGQVYNGQIDISKIQRPAYHYQSEYTFDTTLDPAAWTKQEKGMQVSFASTDQSYFRSEVPKLQKTTSWSGAGWRGERLNALVLVWCTDTVEQVHFVPTDFKSSSGKLISSNSLKLNMVRYVVGNYPYGARDVTCGESPYKGLYLMPDRFEEFDRFDVPGKSVRPVWVSLDIPASTPAGEYSGKIEVKAAGYTAMLDLKITVQQPILPKPHEWKHRLDLWQNPWVVAVENNLKPWSAEHKLLLKKHLQLYAEAGGSYITTYAVHSPWADNSYNIEGGMIGWLKRKNGSWKFDYSIFDEYVQLAMSVGIDKAITIYTPVPWGHRFRYLDEATGTYQTVAWAPTTPEFKSFWNIFLTDLKKHLEQKGWFNKTYIGINENALEETLAAIKVVKGHSPKWKITYAGNWHAELENLLDDYCFLYGEESSVEVVKRRAAKGFTTTYYNCCNPPVPNNFVFSPPIEGRWMGWYTSAHKYDGYLRWAYDAWPADPNRDARHELWAAGDCFLVYPGGNSCVRFEKIREGIVDYEKLRIVQELAAKSAKKEIKELVQQLNRHMEIFLVEKEFNSEKIKADVDKGRALIAEISSKL